MISEFVSMFEANKQKLKDKFRENKPDRYSTIVKAVIELFDECSYPAPDPERITRIDYGDYQGTELYIIAAKGYQPYDFWAVRVSYGSCSGCDTLQAIDEESDPEKRVEEYMTLALHIVQKLKKLE